MSIALASRPAHVPEELVIDFDYFNFAESEPDIFLAWKRVHEYPPIFWTPRNGGHWVATRAADIKLMYTDYERFSSKHEAIPVVHDFQFPPVELDPPQHLDYRTLIVPAFTPVKIDALREQARELSVRLIEGFRTRGECEFYGDFALQMPIGIFLHMVDLPAEDREMLLPLAEQSTRGNDPELMTAAQHKMWAYLEEKFAERRARPGHDLISKLALAEINGRPLNREELIGMGTVILSAGLDTVASTLGFVVHFLSWNTQDRSYIAENPDRIPRVVDEFLRRFPVTCLARMVAKDLVYEGVEMKRDDPILLPSMLYNFDETVFDAPMEIRYDRAQAAHNLTFGWGAHRCVGMALARTELQVFLEEWLGRIPDFQVKPGEKVVTSTGRVSAVTYLPLVWDPSTTRSSSLAATRKS